MVECPLCDYSGTVREVQAHISGKSDPAHKGYSGKDFKRQIQDQKKEASDGSEGGSQGKKENGAENGKANDLPEVKCRHCGRVVRYPEMMPYKATCPGCQREIRKRQAFERLEEQADERGKDETAEPKEV